jgi:hypothetical protein
MNHLSTDDFANCELSIEELDAIAGGSLWGWIKHEATAVGHFFENPTTLKVLAVGFTIAGGIFGSWVNSKNVL